MHQDPLYLYGSYSLIHKILLSIKRYKVGAKIHSDPSLLGTGTYLKGRPHEIDLAFDDMHG
jgi:hypothetical protein